MLKLRVIDGNAAGKEIGVEEEFLIGRTAPGEGKLEDDAEISRQHARVTRAGEGYVLEDLGSMNGTFVNGEKLAEPHQLADGDQLKVGATLIVVQMEEAPGATPLGTQQPPAPTTVTDIKAPPPPPPAAEPPPEAAEPRDQETFVPPSEPAAPEPRAPSEPPPPPPPPPPEPPARPQAPAGPQPPFEPPPPAAEPEPPPPPPPAAEPQPAPAAAEPEPAGEEVPEPAAAEEPLEPTVFVTRRPRVSLHVEIDLEAGEAFIELAEGGDRVALVQKEGRWVLKPEES
jgi:pSer/pThr/pTyr-binding forkhead associated (FHA) protein